MMNQNPRVDILLVTYNHEKFIKQAIDSILFQKVNFDYRIIVADDSSTDSTVDIVLKYKRMYPERFKILESETNIGVSKNYKRGFNKCDAEYIAVLEGDDYWSSPYKLQIQVDFMDDRANCSFCYNRVLVLNEDKFESSVQPEFKFLGDESQLTTENLCEKNFTGNFSSGLYRKSAVEKIHDSFYELTVYDWFFNIVISQYGKIGFIPEVLSVYRKHNDSVWSKLSKNEQDQELVKLIDSYNEYTKYKYKEHFEKIKKLLSADIEYRSSDFGTISKGAMKIAVFDTVLNEGGGKRFLSNLLPAIKAVNKEIVIDLYCNLSRISGSYYYKYLKESGVGVEGLKSIYDHDRKEYLSILQRIINKFLRVSRVSKFQFKEKIIPKLKLEDEIYQISENYDVAYFPWPYLINNIKTACPKVATFHDFNYKYFFGGYIFHGKILQDLNTEIPKWIESSTSVVSTHFMESEILKFYPTAKNVQVAHLGSLSNFTRVEKAKAKEIVENLGIDSEYIIFPTNLTIHKNVGILSKVMYLLKKRGLKIKLVITGPDTKGYANGVVTPYGIEHSNEEPDVIGLGYVTDEEIDSLIQCAKIVISVSKYEAGCGPGLDAWSRGTPVAMSDFPAFVEHIAFLGVKAQLFDPFNADNIADTIEYMLSNYEEMVNDAKISKARIERFSWENTARKYSDVFIKL